MKSPRSLLKLLNREVRVAPSLLWSALVRAPLLVSFTGHAPPPTAAAAEAGDMMYAMHRAATVTVMTAT